MTYLKSTGKSVDDAFAALQTSIAAHGYGLLHTYDLRRTLEGKGFPLANECRILEVCNPRQASEVLAADMSLNMALPCRISIYEDGGRTLIGMIPPSEQLALVSADPAIASAAVEVERVMRAIIDAAA